MEEMKLPEFLIWLITLAVAVVCSFWVVRTYTADTIITGTPQSVSENLVFVIQSPTIVLTEDTSDTTHKTYSVERSFSSVYQVDNTFDAEKYEYSFELNGRCFASSIFEYGEFKCELEMTFIGTNNQDLLTDTLTITIDFYSGSTLLKMTTTGGVQANSYWLSYFNSYGFDMRVYKVGEKL